MSKVPFPSDFKLANFWEVCRLDCSTWGKSVCSNNSVLFCSIKLIFFYHSDANADPLTVNLTIDVTVPLQCLIRDSKLKLQQSSKVRLCWKNSLKFTQLLNGNHWGGNHFYKIVYKAFPFRQKDSIKFQHFHPPVLTISPSDYIDYRRKRRRNQSHIF